MKRPAVPLCVFLILLGSLAAAQKGTFTTYKTAWNGLTRIYSVYLPHVLQPKPALLVVLHGTAIVPESQPPLTACTQGMGWNNIADMNGFVLLCPIASYRGPIGPIPGQFFWESYGIDDYFPINPEDSSFLRSLIVTMEKPVGKGGFGVDSKRVFVMGFSAGAMMTHRACIENADLIAACSPMSGTLWVANPNVSIPLPSQPVSILELHGDADPVIQYCGGLFWGWDQTKILAPSIDVDANYWLAADNLRPNATPLCTGTAATPGVFGLDERAGTGSTVEVQFVRELGFDHTYYDWMIAMVWEFFATHGR